MAGSGSSAYGNKSIGTSAAVLVAARQARESVLVKNNHASQILYLGSDSSVTSSNGLPLAAGESVRIESKNVVYAVASGATTDVRYFEEF
jgi:hypothetical protein